MRNILLYKVPFSKSAITSQDSIGGTVDETQYYALHTLLLFSKQAYFS